MDKFCLRWNDFETNISSAFKELREDKDFFDVTLACDEDQVQAHKVILSACSPFFKTILRRNKHDHPLLYLKGVKYTDLVSVLNFMYHGEVNVAQEELNSFLAVAEDLKVKGLTQNGPSKSQPLPPPSSSPFTRPPPPSPQPPPKRPRVPPVQPQSQSHTQESRDDIPNSGHMVQPLEPDMTPVKAEPLSLAAQSTPSHEDCGDVNPSMYMEEYGTYEESYEDGSEEGWETRDEATLTQSAGNADGNKDLLDVIKSMSMRIQTEDGGHCFRCTMCEYISANQTNLTNHVEKNHLDQCYYCPKCNKEFRSRHAVRIHVQRLHDDEPQTCVICSKILPSRKTMKVHMKNHLLQSV